MVYLRSTHLEDLYAIVGGRKRNDSGVGVSEDAQSLDVADPVSHFSEEVMTDLRFLRKTI